MKALVNENLTGKEVSSVHRFERAGLGKAPFAFTGRMTTRVVPGTNRAGSSCDYCGTGIKFEFWVKSADGNEFKVGCDCIHKTGDRGLIQQISAVERELRDLKNSDAKERKIERLNKRIEEAMVLLNSVRGDLSAMPHPSSYFASEGRTLLDYVNWCFENWASEKACCIIESAAKRKGE